MCRICMATSDLFKVHFYSLYFRLRDITTQKQQCFNILSAGPLKDYYPKVYGILDYSKTKYSKLIGQLQVSKSHKNL